MSKDWLRKVKDEWDYAYESGKYGGYLDIEDIEGLLDRAEMSYRLESEIDDLSMAHDSLHRELSTYKRTLPKDKHTLIKSVISLNKRVQVLEKDKKSLGDLIEKTAKTAWGIEQQNKQIKDAYKDRESDIEYYQKMLGIDFEDMAIELPVERIQGDKIRVIEQQNKRYKELMRKSLPFILADIDLSNEIQDVLEGDLE